MGCMMSATHAWLHSVFQVWASLLCVGFIQEGASAAPQGDMSVVLLQLTSMVQQQTAALQAMVGALQSLAATATRTSHINSRVNARTMKGRNRTCKSPILNLNCMAFVQSQRAH